ncbi:hypothetical protein LTR53_003214 [Teratosphaeriaceae sp. CCFEE 6253]|nr:hypothetical protein LTR53_003214 [Teratosphaeriaceae sp. CCFEE 6253]
MAFQPYYGSGARQTPGKARSTSTAGGITSDDGEVKSVVKGRGRRSTQVKQELASDIGASSPAGPSRQLLPTSPPTTALTTRTPGRPRKSTAAQLPPSPADVANLAEYESTQLYAGLGDLYTASGIPDFIATVRETCSSVTGVQLFFQIIEATGLQRATLPWLWVFDVKLGRGLWAPIVPVYYPDLFALLTNSFWLPALLYLSTAIFVPAVFAYFFNLSTRSVLRRNGTRVSVARYTFDPLMFSVVKALCTYIVYARYLGSAVLWDDRVVTTINESMFGGYQGVLFGCYVVILAALYEAAQRKS